MKIALIALPQHNESVIRPPLPLTYIAALLEQQRHIVRIYDLALRGTLTVAEALAPLRAFRPHIAVIASDDPAATAAVEAVLVDGDLVVVHLGMALREGSPGLAVAQVLWRMDGQPVHEDEQSVIFGALLALDDDLDVLPFPARHLLPLEQYGMFTAAGELQTTVLTGQQLGADSIIPRNPALIIAELRSIVHEHGIWHFVFCGPPLSHDLNWLRTTLYHLGSAELSIGWEGSIDHNCLTADLLQMCRWSGCEALRFTFDAMEVLDSKKERSRLSTIVAQAHKLGILVRADIQLEASYSAVPTLVDLSATFGLDDVRFLVRKPAVQMAAGDRPSLEDVVEMAQSRYRSSRSRQFFVERFGPQLGPMLWRVGRAGLLGRAWQRYADGAEDSNGMVAGSFGS